MSGSSLDGLSLEEKREMLRKMLRGREDSPAASRKSEPARAGSASSDVPTRFYRFEEWEAYQQLVAKRHLVARAGVRDPFFALHEGVARDTTVVDGRTLINFGTYSYLDLNGDPRVTAAAAAAAERWGTSASASRVVSGERAIQGDLERKLAQLVGAEACVVFVSGHATNVSTIGHLLGPRDVLVHDELIHNSVLVGAQLSRAHRKAFSHNDVAELDGWLAENRHRYERVLVAVEGLYSMDGDMAPIPELVELRERYRFLLLVDEAHSIGVLGAKGGGVREQFGLSGSDVDLWMGTLSKSFAAQGGYIAGSKALVEYLKATCPGFVYSVGISPPLAAAALEAIQIMEREPERVRQLRQNGLRFLEQARMEGLDVGLSDGFAVVPVIIGSSVEAVIASNRLFDAGVSVQPIAFPAVPERAARLRFFLTSAHTTEQIDEAVAKVREAVTGR